MGIIITNILKTLVFVSVLNAMSLTDSYWSEFFACCLIILFVVEIYSKPKQVILNFRDGGFVLDDN